MSGSHAAKSKLADSTWWRHVAERIARQDLQVIVAAFSVTGTSAATFDLWGTLVGLLGASLVVFLKNLTPLQASPDEAWYWQLLDRAGGTAASTALGLLGAEQVNVLTTDWPKIGWMTLVSTVVAVGMYYVTPPATSPPAA